ncbi:cardiolipin synthase [Stomatohabitans albus]|uniref:cardiolipin synthase n=1 Tax=Stomatohabitans albus TaxID=3110766 RepID=UPI00300D55F7
MLDIFFDSLPTATVLYSIVANIIRVIAIGVVPYNRRPSAATAWLMLIMLEPIIGTLVFSILGSNKLNARRQRIQRAVNRGLKAMWLDTPDTPPNELLPEGLERVIAMNRKMTELPSLFGINRAISSDYQTSIDQIIHAIDESRYYVHMLFYIMAKDERTTPIFDAMKRAVDRGVRVRVLYDHIGSRKYPGFAEMREFMTNNGIDHHMTAPVLPFDGEFNRPDLRNHRKLMVVDGNVGFTGSFNMIDSTYLDEQNVALGRHWNEVTILLNGQIVSQLDNIFALDWASETNETLPVSIPDAAQRQHISYVSRHTDDEMNVFQLIPSGPGYAEEPNLRLFTTLIEQAQEHVAIVSPYFIPDTPLMQAITSAAYRGVEVELFVNERGDQMMVDLAQRSYYEPLLDAGVTIWLWPQPEILHAKFVTIDRQVSVLGSSNMDMRSFGLNHEISLLASNGNVNRDLHKVLRTYRTKCTVLDRDRWGRRSWVTRYLESLMRLTSALQ